MTTANVWTPGSSIPLVNAEITNLEQQFVATAAQTLFTLTSFRYVPGTSALKIFVNGVKQDIGTSFTETSATSFTLATGLEAGELVTAEGLIGGEAAVSAEASAVVAAAAAVITNADVVLTHADVVSTHADVVLTHADVILTQADVVLTHADALLTDADRVASAASEASCAAYSALGLSTSGAFDFGSIADASIFFPTDYGSVI